MIKITVTFFVLVTFSFHLYAKDTELLVRADKSNPLHLPIWSKMPSTPPACNSSGFSMRFLSANESGRLNPAVFSNMNGSFQYSKFFANDVSVSDVHLNKNQSIFALNYRGGTEGVYSLDKERGLRQLVSPQNFPTVEAMSRPSIVDGEVLFRALHKNGLHSIYHGNEIIFSESNNTAYLYLPTTKNNQITFKMGLGHPGEVSPQNPDQIINVSKTKVTTVIAVDHEVDPNSPFLSFDNSPIPSGDGKVVFIANHKTQGRSLWIYKNGTHHMIFSELESPYKLEYFSPDINKNGDVVFRVINNKRRAVLAWNSKNEQAEVIMEQGQAVNTNEKSLRIIDRDRWPAFSGKPCINDSREVFVHGVLENKENFENKGSGLFKIKL